MTKAHFSVNGLAERERTYAMNPHPIHGLQYSQPRLHLRVRVRVSPCGVYPLQYLPTILGYLMEITMGISHVNRYYLTIVVCGIPNVAFRPRHHG